MEKQVSQIADIDRANFWVNDTLEMFEEIGSIEYADYCIKKLFFDFQEIKKVTHNMEVENHVS